MYVFWFLLYVKGGNKEGSRHAEKVSFEYFLQRNLLQKGVVLLSSAHEFLLCLPNKWAGPLIKKYWKRNGSIHELAIIKSTQYSQFYNLDNQNKLFRVYWRVVRIFKTWFWKNLLIGDKNVSASFSFIIEQEISGNNNLGRLIQRLKSII